MITTIAQLYRFGKFLGLSKKEVNNVLFFHDKKHQTSFRILFILILIVLSSILIFFLISIGINTADSTYPSGTKYSTIKIKDFEKKNEIKYRLWKKIRDRLLQC